MSWSGSSGRGLVLQGCSCGLRRDTFEGVSLVIVDITKPFSVSPFELQYIAGFYRRYMYLFNDHEPNLIAETSIFILSLLFESE